MGINLPSLSQVVMSAVLTVVFVIIGIIYLNIA